MQFLKPAERKFETFPKGAPFTQRNVMEQRTFSERSNGESNALHPALGSPTPPNHTAPELWRSIDEVAEQMGVKTQAIMNRLIPMSYYPDPMAGRIRFRVMGSPRRTELWCPDLAAIQETKPPRRRSGARIETSNRRH
jgi:hypothetical protein